MKLAGEAMKLRAKELKPARDEAEKLWKVNPAIKGAGLKKLLKSKGHDVNITTCYGWLRKFKGIKPSKKPSKVEVAEARAKTRPEEVLPKELSAADVADALLKRVVEALSSYDNMLERSLESKGWKSRALEAEKLLEVAKTENARILKIHNDQVRTRQFTSAGELVRLAKLK